MKNPVPRVAAIHDLSGFGRGSLTAVIPVLSAMKFQVCPLPTALLSTHTGGFENYVFEDLTDLMQPIADHWKKLNIQFDAIYSGFLGSASQIDIVSNFIDDFSCADQIVLVDPVLGDEGKLYGPFDNEIVDEMKRLVEKADIITPNMTEACLLLDRQYTENISVDNLKSWLKSLSEMGPEMVIITSVKAEDYPDKSLVAAYNRMDNRFWQIECAYVPASYPGTGDLFASVLLGSLMQGDSLPIAIERSVNFVLTSIHTTFGHQIPQRYGVLFERMLGSLAFPPIHSSFTILE